MVAKKTKEDLASKINELFEKYRIRFSGISECNMENDEELKALRERITTAVWLYLQHFKALFNKKLIHTFKESATLDSESSVLNEYTLEIVEMVNNCIDTGLKSQNLSDFCRYVFGAIKKILPYEEFKKNLSDKNPSLKIGDKKTAQLNKIQKLRRFYNSRDIYDENEINRKLCLDLILSEKQLQELLVLEKGVASNIINQNEGEEQSVFENYADTKFLPHEKNVENFSVLEEVLSKAETQWSKTNDKMLSELFTVKFLKDIERGFFNGILDANVKDFLLRFTIFNKEIVKSFFSDLDYQLSKENEIAKKGGVGKSAASMKIKRFLQEVDSEITSAQNKKKQL